MSRSRSALLLLALAWPPAVRAANPSLAQDMRGMTQWLSHELAQGLAFNAGSTFDPPREVKGYALQPDLSLGIGRMPLDKRGFPEITVPALDEFGGQNLFPDSVTFPNLALHLRMGLPWRSDVYFRFANATTPSNYKTGPKMTAAVQTNSYGFGVRRHLFGRDEQPTLALGAHFNHVKGRVRLKSKFQVDVEPGFTSDSDLNGALDWNLNSFGLTAVLSKSYGAWTPFGGVGYNYATGSARARLDLESKSPLIEDIVAEGSERPEQNQGRVIFGVEYARPTWSVFANAEVKAIGRLPGKSYIAQVGAALPFEIGRGALIRRKRKEGHATVVPREEAEEPASARRKRKARPAAEEPVESAPDMIFLR